MVDESVRDLFNTDMVKTLTVTEPPVMTVKIKKITHREAWETLFLFGPSAGKFCLSRSLLSFVNSSIILLIDWIFPSLFTAYDLFKFLINFRFPNGCLADLLNR